MHWVNKNFERKSACVGFFPLGKEQTSEVHAQIIEVCVVRVDNNLFLFLGCVQRVQES